ncbi:MAG: homoserine kinase [Candidatus Riflebacteria bacterium]|nr:homoserine kinase [Candidatus Riflebacteria bacterium]
MKKFVGRPVRAYAPATIGNFAAGFDVLGAAIRPVNGDLWGDIVEIRPVEGIKCHSSLTVEGPFGHLVPADRTNLVLVSHALFQRKMRLKGRKSEPVTFTLYKNLPLCSGLGSSASSVVATLRALNLYYGCPLNDGELLQLAGRAEGAICGAAHLDNVAPALLGGLRLIAPGGIPQLEQAVSLPFFDHWRIVVVHPNLSLSTRKSRQVLPSSIRLVDAVEYWQNLASFVHAMHSADKNLAAITLRDLMIEGYRRRLIRGFSQVKAAALKAGAIGCSLSGSGPSIFAVTESDAAARRVKIAMTDAFKIRGVGSDAHICVLDPDGAREA